MVAMFNPLGKTIRLLLAGFTMLALASCQTTFPSAGGQGSGGGAISVALLVPHGSTSVEEQLLARDLENAARLAASDLSGVQIDLRVYGTAGDATQAQNAAIRAMDEGASIVVGPLHATSANAVAVAAAPRNVNVLAFSNNPTIAGGNLFVLGQTFDTTADRLTDYAVSQGKRRIMTLHSDNVAGQLGRSAIARAVASRGAQSAGSVAYEFSQQGVVGSVPTIRATAQTNQADAIFLTANAAGALPLFTQMLPEAGLSKEQIQYIGLARWDKPPQTLELPGVQDGWFAMPDPQREAQFRNRFQSAHGNAPHALAGLSYDAIAAIGALAQSGNPDALSRGSLLQPAGFQGVNGIFRFRPDGTTDRGLAVVTVRDSQLFILSPAPTSFGGSGF